MPGIGCSSWCLMDRGLAEVLEILSARTGTVEILSDANHDLLSLWEDCASFDLRYTVHAPTTDINIASIREPIRHASVSLIGEVCGKAAEIGATCMVVHPGFSPWIEMFDRSHKALRHSLRALAAVQDEHGVPIAIENMGSWQVCHFRDPALLPVLEEEGLSFCLDVGHAHVNGMLMEFLSAMRPAHVHLHDNDGSADAHMALGRGTVDLREILPLLPRDSAWILEMPQVEWLDQSIGYLKARQIWSMGEDITRSSGCQNPEKSDPGECTREESSLRQTGGERRE